MVTNTQRLIELSRNGPVVLTSLSGERGAMLSYYPRRQNMKERLDRENPPQATVTATGRVGFDHVEEVIRMAFATSDRYHA